jgi:hypothetical protein
MAEGKQEGSGSSPVGTIGIVILTTYLVLLSLALFYCLYVLWPRPTAPQVGLLRNTVERVAQVAGTSIVANGTDLRATGSDSSLVRVLHPDTLQVKLLNWPERLDDEARLLLLVVCTGSLGSLVHGLRSIYWYLGNRELVWSWVPKYLIQPFGAAVLAVIFYLVIRGGFFSAESNPQHTSPFGFMALSAMVGMFSEQAVLKLKEIAETVLSKPPAGKDSKPQSKAEDAKVA